MQALLEGLNVYVVGDNVNTRKPELLLGVSPDLLTHGHKRPVDPGPGQSIKKLLGREHPRPWVFEGVIRIVERGKNPRQAPRRQAASHIGVVEVSVDNIKLPLPDETPKPQDCSQEILRASKPKFVYGDSKPPELVRQGVRSEESGHSWLEARPVQMMEGGHEQVLGATTT